jgi:hypothetical protein
LAVLPYKLIKLLKYTLILNIEELVNKDKFNPVWVTGLTGGSFFISIFKNKDYKKGWQVQPAFAVVGLLRKYLNILWLIQSFFGVGKIKENLYLESKNYSKIFSKPNQQNFIGFHVYNLRINIRTFHTAISLHNNHNKGIPLQATYDNASIHKTLILKENRNKCGIYRWTNKITGSCYIGSSLNLSRRFMQYYS